MIYLRYAYRKSTLPEPATVTLCIEDNQWVKTEVSSEISCLFPNSRITLNLPEEPIREVDLIILVYRRALHSQQDIVAWSSHYEPHARLALAFFCIDHRHFEVVPRRVYGRWKRRRRLQMFLGQQCSKHPKVWHLIQRVSRQCAFLW